MAVAVTRLELDASDLRREATRCRDAKAARRMLALALVLEGHRARTAARHAGMDRQTLRDWVHRYNAEGLAGLRDRPHPGPTPRLTPEQLAELATHRRERTGPGDGRHRALAAGRPAGRDRAPLRRPAARALGRQGPAPARLRPPVGAAPSTRRASPRRRTPSKRLRPAGAGGAARARGRQADRDLVHDEARVGQQGTLTRIWARRGTRPRAPRDRRYAWAYLFGAVCPERAVGAGLVLPFANAAAMSLHLQEISRHVTLRRPCRPGARRRRLARRWRRWTIPRQPQPRCRCRPIRPSSTRSRIVWQYLRQNQLSLRVWPDYEAIVETCCQAWNALMAMPDRIASITRREWAKTVTS